MEDAPKFRDLLADPDIRQRFEKVRQYAFLRESTYDMTSCCNLRCDGCYYFEGQKQHAPDVTDESLWRTHFEHEKQRGITYAVLAGAEPSLVQRLCKICSDVIPFGCVATNGLARLDESIAYRIHVSVWGDEQTSVALRRAPCLQRQLDNYADDPRAVFIYTFTAESIEQASDVVERIVAAGARVSFNQFSAPIGYRGPLRMEGEHRRRMARVIVDLLERFPERVLYSAYNIEVHCGDLSLAQRFGCPYPRARPNARFGIGRTFRQYRTDLSFERSASCCVPDTDCADCRHYAAGSAIVSSKLVQHAADVELFQRWLDYVDTYLAVWVKGYEKSPNLAPLRSTSRAAASDEEAS